MRELYTFVLKESSGLRKTSYALTTKPKTLKILRLLLGIGQRDLAKMLSTSQGTIWCLEQGRTKKIPKEFLDKMFAEFTRKKIRPVSFEELKEREIGLSAKGKFNGEYASEMAKKSRGFLGSAKSKKPTAQEEEISSFLRQNNIAFETNAFVDFGNVRFLCDFAIPNKETPKLFVEVKRLNTAYSKRLAIFDLAYRALKIKTKMPNVRLIAIIDGSLLDSDRKILKEEYDMVLNTAQKNELLRFISLD